MQAFIFHSSVFLKGFAKDHLYAFTIFSLTYTRVNIERYNVQCKSMQNIIKDIIGIFFAIKLGY